MGHSKHREIEKSKHWVNRTLQTRGEFSKPNIKTSKERYLFKIYRNLNVHIRDNLSDWK